MSGRSGNALNADHLGRRSVLADARTAGLGRRSRVASVAAKFATPLLLATTAAAAPAQEIIGTIETTEGTALVAATSQGGAFPFVVLTLVRPGEPVSNAPLGRFAAMDMRVWVLRVRDSISVVDSKERVSRPVAFAGDPVIDIRRGWGLGSLVRTSDIGSREGGLILFHETEGTAIIWLRPEQFRDLLEMLALACDRSVELSPSFPLLERYRPISPRPPS